MQIRRIEKTDIKELYEIHQKHYNFAFPDLSSPLYAIQEVITEKDKIVLAGIVKLTSEVIFITNKDIPNLTIMKGIKLANEQMFKDATNLGLEDFHVFAENDDNFINILRKLGFLDCTGYPMVRLK